jgi:hypothetical protein
MEIASKYHQIYETLGDGIELFLFMPHHVVSPYQLQATIFDRLHPPAFREYSEVAT